MTLLLLACAILWLALAAMTLARDRAGSARRSA
jgi:hypothetical protein